MNRVENVSDRNRHTQQVVMAPTVHSEVVTSPVGNPEASAGFCSVNDGSTNYHSLVQS